MFLDGLDELDQKIVQLLIKNARISYSELGEQVGISRVAVKMRVQALEKHGIIEEYTTIVNPQKISGAVSCYFEMEFLPEALARRPHSSFRMKPSRRSTASPGETSSMSMQWRLLKKKWKS